jgi:sugar lactone lactonase YvrE
LPFQQPTCPAFGGDKLDVMYMTSARWRLPDADLAKQPYAGGLCALDAGVKGLPEPTYRG